MYANEYNFDYKEYDASHSLWEVIDEVAEEIVKFFNSSYFSYFFYYFFSFI